ncbi:uncharacterized protein LOC110093347 [Dendrobium catenatum]|uniref:uncharacterized protein LOC110093347 n=1 Tax=Dendrobium catenatum TaxID=906689 RepID=UPI0009F24B35|nr:uncharacterized protein LOC110093347 [Dendrobium catenatum]
MGLFSAVTRISPLRARLSWRFLNNPSSLLHICIEARYDNDIWQGSPKHKHSYSAAWSILLDGATSLRPIVKWQIANGKNINVMNDIWLMDKCFSKWPVLADCVGLNGLSLQHFIQQDGQWDLNELNRFFNIATVNLILQNCVINKESEDQIVPLFQLSGKSITALAYAEVIKHNTPNDDFGFSNWLRKLKLKPKIEFFWWRMSRFALPTNEFLKYRRLQHSDLCPRGCPETEVCLHIAVRCKHLIDIISKLQSWGFSIPIFHSLDNCLSQLRKLANDHVNTVKIYCTDVYYSWKCRNDSLHGNPLLPLTVVAANILSTIKSKFPMLVDWGASLHLESNSSWHPPPLD